jgi:hypothetical protein
MSFSDSDWTSEAAASAVAGRHDGGWIWTLVLGVVIGAAGATLVFLMVERLSQREAHQAVARAPLPATAPAMPPPPAAVVETAPPAAGRVEPSAASAAASPAAPVPTVPTAAPRPSADELRRKERAWAAYYKRPSSCEGNPTTDQLIECANHFIRSKRDFDERWKAGTL